MICTGLDRRARTALALLLGETYQWQILLLMVPKDHFRQLRLPTMGQEFEKLPVDAAATNQNFFQFLLCLTATELATRAANAIATRIKNAEFPVLKDFDPTTSRPCHTFPSPRSWS